MLGAAGESTRSIAMGLMGLVDADPETVAGPSQAHDDTQVLYVAASAGTNLHNGVAQHALRLRPRATLHEVDGTHFTFLTASAHEVAQAANEFLLGATALLG